MNSQEYKIGILRDRVLEWGKKNKRILPWRQDKTSYKVLISEIMLHRTRSSQVIDHYYKFIRRYPDFKSICDAGMDSVMNDLKSLGLTWRAKMLYELSCTVLEKHGGELPLDKSVLLTLPGVGEYIASAILCFALDQSEPILDTNTVRIIGRFFGMKMTDSSRRSKKYRNLMRKIIEGVPCSEISYAMLDFGSLVCRKNNPKCCLCPLKDMCAYGSTEKENCRGVV